MGSRSPPSSSGGCSKYEIALSEKQTRNQTQSSASRRISDSLSGCSAWRPGSRRRGHRQKLSWVLFCIKLHCHCNTDCNAWKKVQGGRSSSASLLSTKHPLFCLRTIVFRQALPSRVAQLQWQKLVWIVSGCRCWSQHSCDPEAALCAGPARAVGQAAGNKSGSTAAR